MQKKGFTQKCTCLVFGVMFAASVCGFCLRTGITVCFRASETCQETTPELGKSVLLFHLVLSNKTVLWQIVNNPLNGNSLVVWNVCTSDYPGSNLCIAGLFFAELLKNVQLLRTKQFRKWAQLPMTFESQVLFLDNFAKLASKYECFEGLFTCSSAVLFGLETIWFRRALTVCFLVESLSLVPPDRN